jgi:hypothetical protein
MTALGTSGWRCGSRYGEPTRAELRTWRASGVTSAARCPARGRRPGQAHQQWATGPHRCVADPESCGARRVTVTYTGRARYVTWCQVHHSPDSGGPPTETAPGGRPDTTTPVDPASLAGDAGWGDLQRGMLETGQVVINPGVHRGTPRPTDLPVIAPQFPTTSPAGRRLSRHTPLPAPGGQPDPGHQAREFSGGHTAPARGAATPARPVEVVVATPRGHAEARP